MPYPNFHSATVIPRTKFAKVWAAKYIRKGVYIVLGKLKGASRPEDPTVAQSYRFNKTYFTAAQAKAWMKKHGKKIVKFVKATGTGKRKGLAGVDATLRSGHCDYKCYLHKTMKRVYCRRLVKKCVPDGGMPKPTMPTPTRKKAIIMTDIEGKKHDVTKGFWYGSSARPAAGLFIKGVKQIVTLTDKISDKKPFFDMVQTTKRMPDKEVYDYELTPLSPAGWLKLNIKELEEDYADPENAKYLLEMPITKIQSGTWFSIKEFNKYANARTVPKAQIEALTNHLIILAKKAL